MPRFHAIDAGVLVCRAGLRMMHTWRRSEGMRQPACGRNTRQLPTFAEHQSAEESKRRRVIGAR